jgi:hypothetical protein
LYLHFSLAIICFLIEVCLFHQCSFCHILMQYYRCTVPSVVDVFLAWFSWVNS